MQPGCTSTSSCSSRAVLVFKLMHQGCAWCRHFLCCYYHLHRCLNLLQRIFGVTVVW
jgi:hypothetical protein